MIFLNAISVLFVFVFIFGCSEGKVMKEVGVIVGEGNFIIPVEYFSNKDDFAGGSQSAVTLDFQFPSMHAFLDKPSDGFIRTGAGIRVLLTNHGANPDSSLSSVLKHKASSIVSEVKIGDAVKYETKDDDRYEYYFVSNGSGGIFLSCTKDDGPGFSMCRSASKEIFPTVYASYYFSTELIKDVKVIDLNVFEVLKNYKTEVAI